jgi:chromosome segregation ATPase
VNEEQQRKIDSLQNALLEKEAEFRGQEERLATLTDVSRERDFQLRTIIELKEKVAECEGVFQANARLVAEVAELRAKISENEGGGQEWAMTEQSLQEKNAVIANLRALLDKAVKSDERKQVQIEELQRERSVLMLNLQNARKEAGSDGARLQHEPTPMIQELQRANAELESRNRKMQEMLEKSHEVYARLLAEHQGMAAERTFCCSVVFDRNENGKAQSRRMSGTAEREAKLVRAAYLRRVLLQFFSQEMESERNTLVPLILELVGCTKEQISVVIRHYSRSEHLIAKTSGLFRS